MNSSQEASELPTVYGGVDVGGTNVKIGIVDDAGQILAQCKFPTEPEKSPTVAIEKSNQAINEILSSAGIDQQQLAAIGLGTPGPLDLQSGKILTPVNLPGWRDFPIRDELAAATGRPVSYVNDAGAAAFGEYWAGGAEKYKSMILITLGTGVGGGIIIDDRSIDGAHSMGAEIGHMVIDNTDEARKCGCGRLGHLEAYASATSVAKRAQEGLASRKDSLLNQGDNEDSPITSLSVFQAATQSDKYALELVIETALRLGDAIATLAHIIDPAIVLLGGAMNFGGSESPVGTQFLEEIRSRVKNCTFPEIGKSLTIDFAKLGSSAGLVGAAGIARRDFLNQNTTAAPVVSAAD